MAASSRCSGVHLRPHHDTGNRPKHKASVSVSSVAITDKVAPKPQRSASTSHDRHRPSSSFLGSLFRPAPSVSTTSAAPRARTAECLTCGSDHVAVRRSAKLACGHRMCNSCLRRIFVLSIKDAQHMPPTCCTSRHIPLKHVEHLFDDRFKMLWNRKYQEYTTKNRLYCPAKGCGQWIKPADLHKLHGRKYGRCPRCKTKVCTLCNNKFHPSSECPQDPETARLVDMAKEKGWQRCFNCKAMVELKEGCNHMTCRCGAEFCMLCASPWKTCECPWFNSTAPHNDRLNHMRVPEEIRPDRSARNDRNDRNEPNHRHDRHARNPALTYQQEIDARRNQERTDEALARRLQASYISHPPPPPRRIRRHSATDEVFGNQGSHFLNEDFVPSTARINASLIGDAAFARRGERESGRRSRRQSSSYPSRMDAGLAPNAFGTESMLGSAAPPPMATLRRSSTLRERLGSISIENGRERIGGWLNRLG